eukprot:7993524-Pyramimonas_sp.AAC.1
MVPILIWEPAKRAGGPSEARRPPPRLPKLTAHPTTQLVTPRAQRFTSQCLPPSPARGPLAPAGGRARPR